MSPLVTCSLVTSHINLHKVSNKFAIYLGDRAQLIFLFTERHYFSAQRRAQVIITHGQNGLLSDGVEFCFDSLGIRSTVLARLTFIYSPIPLFQKVWACSRGHSSLGQVCQCHYLVHHLLSIQCMQTSVVVFLVMGGRGRCFHVRCRKEQVGSHFLHHQLCQGTSFL